MLTGLLAGCGEGKAATEEEDDTPAHLGFYQPPADEAGRVLEAPAHSAATAA